MQKILITWTSSGIWKYLWENLRKDYFVMWVSRSDDDIWLNRYFKWDLQDSDFLDKIASDTKELDYLIINAWVWYFDDFKSISEDQNKEIINTNLLSPILLINKLLKLNKIKSWIIFIWSSASKKSTKYWASYSASKFGIRWFAMSLKNELKWLKVHLINPNIIDTWFHKSSKIQIVWKHKETSLNDVLETIKNLISWNETRFEIDL